MEDVAVIEDPAAAEVSLDPIRNRLLAELAVPGSAAMLAGKVGLPRQKVNYHLRTLEQHGLVRLVGERRRGNVTERMMQATAASYVISPNAMASVAPDPDRAPDRLSARWLLALAARLVREVGSLITGSARARQRVATFAIDGEVRFASPSERAAFAEELTTAVTDLLGRYHSEAGRKHRIVVALHPALDSAAPPAQQQMTTAPPATNPAPAVQEQLPPTPAAALDRRTSAPPDPGPDAHERPTGAPPATGREQRAERDGEQR
uniref:ArsR/SmtB family transcription factor n=1 Tax=Paractinoplanes polyasparticus TaxID=2856853 RepID=UPI0027E21095|nr:helix-turn-helix domain-containing protein [Actinoplanes polyasparticus]